MAEFPIISIKSDISNKEGSLRKLLEFEFGALDDSKLMDKLENLSLSGNDLSKWKKPVFFAVGKNDPRANIEDVRKVKNKLFDFKKEVWYLESQKEGHGFTNYENYLYLKVSEFKFIERFVDSV